MKLEFLEYLFKEKFEASASFDKVQQEVEDNKRMPQDGSRSTVERGLQREIIEQKVTFAKQRLEIATKTIETYADTHGIEREKPDTNL